MNGSAAVMLRVGAGIVVEVATPLRGGGRATAREGKDRPGGMKGGRGEVAGGAAAADEEEGTDAGAVGCRGGMTGAGSGAGLDLGAVSGHRDDFQASNACICEKRSAGYEPR